ncbi:MAG: hypothetical protein ACM3ZC_06995 [Bacteroidota bacterium]
MHKWTNFWRVLLVCAVLSAIAAAAPILAQDTAEHAGIVFQTLSPADLYAIQRSTGYRLGVMVAEVKQDSPAAGILSAGDIIMAIGQTGVDSAQGAAAALQGASGQVALVAVVNRDGVYAAQMPQAADAAPGAPFAGAVPAPGGAAGVTALDLAGAYFDLLDFMRTQAWAKACATPAAERQRVAALLENSWTGLDDQSRATLLQFPDTWGNLKKAWPTLGAAKQNELRAHWRTLLLLPTLIYPPLANPRVYQSGGSSFQYPAEWTGGEASANGAGYLFLGPGGASATWERVMNAATSPAGGFFTLAPLPANLQSMSILDGARLYVRQYVAVQAPEMKEIHAAQSGQAAIVVLRGKFPGQQEEKFFWVVIIPLGSTTFDRYQAQLPQCGFGKEGVCCQLCSHGPCRITPKAPRAFCGATADMIAARNLLRLACHGLSAYCHQLEEGIATLKATAAEKTPFEICAPRKLRILAEWLGVDDQRENNVLAAVVADALTQELRKGTGEPLKLVEKLAPQSLLARWRALGIVPGGPLSELRDAMTMAMSNINTDPARLILAAMRLSVATGYMGLIATITVQDILLGDPGLGRTEADLGVSDPRTVNIVAHGHVPYMAAAVLRALNEDPGWTEKARAAGAEGISYMDQWIPARNCCSGSTGPGRASPDSWATG